MPFYFITEQVPNFRMLGRSLCASDFKIVGIGFQLFFLIRDFQVVEIRAHLIAFQFQIK
jgi:hypothetical protein